jgi:hypothetical protein
VYNDHLPNTTYPPRPWLFERLLTTLFAFSSAWVIRLILRAWLPTAAYAGRQRRRQVGAPIAGDTALCSVWLTLCTAALLHPRSASTSSHATQTPEHSPVDTMRTQFVAELPQASSPVQNGAPALLRKKSSPMMPPFMVSAPGKVIVYGEHAVVHGKVRSSPLAKSESG